MGREGNVRPGDADHRKGMLHLRRDRHDPVRHVSNPRSHSASLGISHPIGDHPRCTDDSVAVVSPGPGAAADRQGALVFSTEESLYPTVPLLEKLLASTATIVMAALLIGSLLANWKNVLHLARTRDAAFYGMSTIVLMPPVLKLVHGPPRMLRGAGVTLEEDAVVRLLAEEIKKMRQLDSSKGSLVQRDAVHEGKHGRMLHDAK